MIGSDEKITDVCLVCRDIEKQIAFYRDKVGFRLRRRAEGFADFTSETATLALWEARHIERHVGISARLGDDNTHKVMIACEVADADRVHLRYRELVAGGVTVHGAPRTYPWGAHAFYFTDPEGNLWEVYAWLEDPTDYHNVAPSG